MRSTFFDTNTHFTGTTSTDWTDRTSRVPLYTRLRAREAHYDTRQLAPRHTHAAAAKQVAQCAHCGPLQLAQHPPRSAAALCGREDCGSPCRRRRSKMKPHADASLGEQRCRPRTTRNRRARSAASSSRPRRTRWSYTPLLERLTSMRRARTRRHCCAHGRRACLICTCLLYTSPSPRDQRGSRMPSSA